MGGNYLAQTPVRQTGCDLHRMSVTGNPFRHVRSETLSCNGGSHFICL